MGHGPANRTLVIVRGAGMADAIGDRVRRYIFDGGDEDLRRLLSVPDLPTNARRLRGFC
jgi:hypothetical protein